MSKFTLKREILKEIKNINTLIDMRIIKGISYKDLSRRHRFLMSELNSLRSKRHSYVSYVKVFRNPVISHTKAPKRNTFGFFGMLGRYVSAFLF